MQTSGYSNKTDLKFKEPIKNIDKKIGVGYIINHGGKGPDANLCLQEQKRSKKLIQGINKTNININIMIHFISFHFCLCYRHDLYGIDKK